MRRDPDDPEPHYDLGCLLLAGNQPQPALEAFQQALRRAPGHPQILLQIGNALSALGRYEDAAAQFRAAQRADPRQPAALYNLGNALRELGRPQEAAASYRAALTLDPHDADTHNNLGNALRELGQLDQAVACYREALRLNPALHHARMHLLHQRMHLCDWEGLDAEIEALRNIVRTEPKAQISPFAFLALPGTTAAEQRQCASHWTANRCAALSQMPRQASPAASSGKRLRIGYLSADFRQHPLTWLAAELIEKHDRQRTEVFGYSYGPDDGSAERKRWVAAFDHFRDIRSLTLQDAAAQIRANGIDILVDLTGYTQSSRSALLALRPAPVQVSWLGFPGSMGADFVDYLISDAWITPPDAIRDYQEKLVWMPHTYQPNGARPEAPTPARADCGLPEAATVLCCFNQSFKITPQLFDLWIDILGGIDNGILWLLECNHWAKANLQRAASARGIDPQRLVFAPRTDIASHLARQRCADLFLDTLPYNAHTTTSDALWAGLPVLTLSGDTFSARVAGSLLHAAGLPELVTRSLPEYRERALQLASHPDLLQGLRTRLEQNRDRLPLFDAAGFARDLERAFAAMWQRHAAGLPPDCITVADL